MSDTISLRAQRIATFAIFLVGLLQPLWHAWLSPPRFGDPAITALLASAPWVLVALATLRNPRRGVLWGGTLALFYFAHGVAVGWSGSGIERALALFQVALSIGVILPPGYVAWRARRRARSPAQ